MSRRLIEWSLDNRAVVLLLTLLMAGIGLYCLTVLPIDAVPDVTNVQVQINTNAPGLAPEEVERFITFPIEQAMTGLPDVTQVRSLSKYGLSQVTVVFEDRVDIYFARSLVFERLQDARGQIPEGLGEPEMGPISSGLGEIYQYQVAGEGLTPQELRTIQDWEVKRQLRTVPGITEVNSFGGQEMQYEVLVDPDLLRARGLSLRDVFRALAENNRNAGAGFLEHRDEQYLVRGIGMLRGPEDIGNVVIAEVRGTPVFVRDVARVVEGSALRQGAVTRDGKGEIVTGIAMMLIHENSRIVAQRTDARVREINESLPEGVRLEPFYDRTELVNRTIRTVAQNLAEGALLVVVVLFAILGNFRASLVVALAIPLSMLFAAILMTRFGISGNLMSLGAIDFGMVVDGAVVMVENTVRRLSQASGRDVLAVVREAALEVGKPIVFGVGTIMVVYLPILTLTGMEGKMFLPMAWTVVFALGGSLLLALTTIPVLASLFLKAPRHARPGAEAEHEGA
ncbi:MAG: efflux RND transporter permease subunit, partial [Candidatus Methylomirabilis sp.]|nr:efflux RND transporter permease subunit [Deltaproteobacteria bacterium]